MDPLPPVTYAGKSCTGEGGDVEICTGMDCPEVAHVALMTNELLWKGDPAFAGLMASEAVTKEAPRLAVIVIVWVEATALVVIVKVALLWPRGRHRGSHPGAPEGLPRRHRPGDRVLPRRRMPARGCHRRTRRDRARDRTLARGSRGIRSHYLPAVSEVNRVGLKPNAT